MESLHTIFQRELARAEAQSKGRFVKRQRTVELAPPSGDWIERLLGRVTVRTALRGRLRFHLDFRGDEILADTLRRELQRLDGVKLESYSVRTRTALVTFDEAKAAPVEVATAVLAAVRSFAKVHGDCDLDHHHHQTLRATGDACGHEEDCAHDHSALATDAGIRKELLKLGVTGAALGFFLWRRVRGGGAGSFAGPLTDVRALLTIAAGYPIFKSGVAAVQKQGRATDDTLISIAVVATLLLGESLTGLSVVWLINLGKLLEGITLKRSRTAIKELLDLAPLEAWVVEGAGATPSRTPVEAVRKGQVIRVFGGEKVPLDGTVVRGGGAVKESFLTGEPLARKKGEGDEVYAGSLVEAGELDVKVRNLVTETVVARMIDAIENLRENKAPIEKVGARFASRFVPISLALSGVTLLVTGDLRRAITMLVIACPCAAGLATPTAVSAAIGQAARRGILIKGGTHVESAAHVDAVVLDKTGTLTAGHPTLEAVLLTESGEALGRAECLTLAASAEQHSPHPLAVCLVRAAKKEGAKPRAVEEFQVLAGFGVTARLGAAKLDLGSERYMRSLGVAVPDAMTHTALSERFPGDSIVYMSRDDTLLAVFALVDAVRPEALQTIQSFRSLGVRRILLATGDQPQQAMFVAARLSLDEVHAAMLPDDKLALIDRLKGEGYKVAMVGDGINDAQALTHADLSIAMGAGKCDVAIETADVTLARDDLTLAAETLDISRRTLATIHQNFFFSVGINALGVGAGALGRLSPFAGALVHNASTIAVVLNSLRLGRQVARKNPLGVLKEIKI